MKEDIQLGLAEADGIAHFRSTRGGFRARFGLAIPQTVFNPHEVSPGKPREGHEELAWAWSLGWRREEYLDEAASADTR